MLKNFFSENLNPVYSAYVEDLAIFKTIEYLLASNTIIKCLIRTYSPFPWVYFEIFLSHKKAEKKDKTPKIVPFTSLPLKNFIHIFAKNEVIPK